MIGIYKIENLINGKIYIGQSVCIEKRWQFHKREGRNLPKGEKSAPIHKAIHKYGIENFKFSIVEECDKSLLDDRECYWIRTYDCYNNGYNATIGGNQNRDHLNKKVYYYDASGVLLGSFDSISLASQKLNIPQPTISLCCLGKYSFTHGFQFSFSIEEKTPVKTGNGRPKRVQQFTKEGEFVRDYESASEAARAMGVSKYSISNCCRGKQKTSAGYIWKYL